MVEFVNDEQTLLDKLAEVRAAQAKFATYTQEQVDKIFFAAAMAANKARIPLAKLAVEETGMGVVEDKVIKNHYASEYIYNAYKDVKTCGVLEYDEGFGIKKIAEPVGVIAAIIPTTNPTSTAIYKALIALKTRNALIISPHPRAKKCTIAAAKVVLDAAVKAGAPEGIIGWIDEPTVPLSGMIMKEADLILATGGPGMVKAAYSSGKPAVGVGPGNTPAIIDESADHRRERRHPHGGGFGHSLQDVRQRHDLRVRAIGRRSQGRLQAIQGGDAGGRRLLPHSGGDGESAQDHPHQRRAQRQDCRSAGGQNRRDGGRKGARGQQGVGRRGHQRRPVRRVRSRKAVPCARDVQGGGL